MKNNKLILGIFMIMLVLISACGSIGGSNEYVEAPILNIPATDTQPTKLNEHNTGTGIFYPEKDDGYCERIHDRLGPINNDKMIDLQDFWTDNAISNDLEVLFPSAIGSLSSRFVSTKFSTSTNFLDDPVGYQIIGKLFNNLAVADQTYIENLRAGNAIGLVICGDSRVNCAAKFLVDGIEYVVSEQRQIGSPSALFPREVSSSVLLTHGNTCSDPSGCGAQGAFASLVDDGGASLREQGIPEEIIKWLDKNIYSADPRIQAEYAAAIQAKANSFVNGRNHLTYFGFYEHGTENFVIRGVVDEAGNMAIFKLDESANSKKVIEQLQDIFAKIELGELDGIAEFKHFSTSTGEIIDSSAAKEALKFRLSNDIGKIKEFHATQVRKFVQLSDSGWAVANRVAMAGQAPIENVIYASKSGRPISSVLPGSEVSGNTFKITANSGTLIAESNVPSEFKLVVNNVKEASEFALSQNLYAIIHTEWADVTWLLADTETDLVKLTNVFFSNNIASGFLTNKDRIYVVTAVVDEAGLLNKVKVLEVPSDLAEATGGIRKIIGGTEVIEKSIHLEEIEKILGSTPEEIYYMTKWKSSNIYKLYQKIAKSRFGRFAGSVFKELIPVFDLIFVNEINNLYRIAIDQRLTYDASKIWNEQNINLDIGYAEPFYSNSELISNYPNYISNYEVEMSQSPGRGVDPYMYKGLFHQAITNDQLFESYVDGATSLLTSLNLETIQSTWNTFWSPMLDLTKNDPVIFTKGIVLSYIDGSAYRVEDEKRFTRRVFSSPLMFLPVDYSVRKFAEVYVPNLEEYLKSMEGEEVVRIVDRNYGFNERKRVRHIFSGGDGAAAPPMIVLNRMTGEFVAPCTDTGMVIAVRAINPIVPDAMTGGGLIYYLYVYSEYDDNRIHIVPVSAIEGPNPTDSFDYIGTPSVDLSTLGINQIPTPTNDIVPDNSAFEVCYIIDDRFNFVNIQEITLIDYNKWQIVDIRDGKTKNFNYNEEIRAIDEEGKQGAPIKLWVPGNVLKVPKGFGVQFCPEYYDKATYNQGPIGGQDAAVITSTAEPQNEPLPVPVPEPATPETCTLNGKIYSGTIQCSFDCCDLARDTFCNIYDCCSDGKGIIIDPSAPHFGSWTSPCIPYTQAYQ